MGILEGKKALVFGVANNRSIAWGIAQALHREGAQLAFSYAGAALLRRVAPLAEQVGADFVEQCDLSRGDDDLERLFAKASAQLGNIDILIHSVAFANRDELNGPYCATSREGFRMALDISCYSFTAVCQRAERLLSDSASLLTLSYVGAERVTPHYNVMGVAKAALEASVRYLASDLGPRGIRVNAISAGPIKTLAASGIGDFRYILKWNERNAPLRRNVTTEDVGGAAVYLLSDLARAVTGEVHHVDCGYHVVGMKAVDAPDITKG